MAALHDVTANASPWLYSFYPQVAAEYKTVAMSSAFPPEFLHPLLKMSFTDDAGLRITVQDILHTLIDRHGNTQKLTSVEYDTPTVYFFGFFD